MYPTHLLKMEIVCIICLKEQVLCSMWLSSIMYETSSLPGAKHLFLISEIMVAMVFHGTYIL